MARDGFSFAASIATPALLIPVTWLAVLTRCWVKKIMLRSFTLDDWFLVLSQLLFTGTASIATVAACNGSGKYPDVLTGKQIRLIYKLILFGEMFYLITTVTVKISIAILLLRLAIERVHRLVVYATSIFYTVAGFVSIFIICFQCRPVTSFWDLRDQSRCYPPDDLAGLVYANAALSAVTDFIFAVLPIWIIWNIRMDRQTKCSVSLVLGLGILGCSVNIVRFKYINNFIRPVDNTHDFFVIGTLSIIEIGVGIIAASMATFKPLIRIIMSKMPSFIASYGLRYGPNSRCSVSGQGRKMSTTMTPSTSKGTPQTNEISDAEYNGQFITRPAPTWSGLRETEMRMGVGVGVSLESAARRWGRDGRGLGEDLDEEEEMRQWGRRCAVARVHSSPVMEHMGRAGRVDVNGYTWHVSESISLPGLPDRGGGGSAVWSGKWRRASAT